MAYYLLVRAKTVRVQFHSRFPFTKLVRDQTFPPVYYPNTCGGPVKSTASLPRIPQSAFRSRRRFAHGRGGLEDFAEHVVDVDALRLAFEVQQRAMPQAGQKDLLDV